MRCILVLLFAALPLLAQVKRVFLITDARRVADVCRQDQTDPKDAENAAVVYRRANAAVQGFFEGGASEVLVWDGHDGSQTLSALTIDPRAKLVMGALNSTMLMGRVIYCVA